MKITRRQLRRIIEGYKDMLSKDHVDGQVWSGTLQDLARVQGKTFGGGTLVNPKEYDKMVSLAKDFTKGKVKSIVMESDRKITQSQLRRLIREAVIDSLDVDATSEESQTDQSSAADRVRGAVDIAVAQARGEDEPEVDASELEFSPDIIEEWE